VGLVLLDVRDQERTITLAALLRDLGISMLAFNEQWKDLDIGHELIRSCVASGSACDGGSWMACRAEAFKQLDVYLGSMGAWGSVRRHSWLRE